MASSTRSPDVLVIGAGAVGAAVAYEVAREGASTVLVEAGPHVAAGCSAGNAGLVCPSHSAPLANPKAVRDGIRWMFDSTSPFYLRPRPAVLPWLSRFLMAAKPRRAAAATKVLLDLTTASLYLHREYVQAGVPTGYETRGILDIFEDEATFAAAQAKVAAAADRLVGLTAQPMSGDEAREMTPSLSQAVVGAMFFGQEGHCDGRQFVEAVAGAAAAAGAEVHVSQPVRRLRHVAGKVTSVDVGNETYTPGTVVLAAGAWSRALAKEVGLRIPIEAGKGYHIDIEPSTADPELPVFMTEARVIATPLAGRLRLSGTLELAGLDTTINAKRAQAVRVAVERVLPHVEGRTSIDTWSGLRPCAPDGLPVIGRSHRLSNLVVATGHAMMGLAMAPITGRLIAELLDDQPTRLDLAPLSPDRFSIGGRRGG
jgi:D-amino-acid dehydrogenase